MYRSILIAHSAWRWVVIALGAMTLLRAASGVYRDKTWDPDGARLPHLFSISLDIQLLMGAALFLSLSPLTTIAISATQTRLPHDSQLYFFAVVHPAMMVTAFIAVHVATSLVKSAGNRASRARRALVFYGITWLIVLSGTPWWRPMIRLWGGTELS